MQAFPHGAHTLIGETDNKEINKIRAVWNGHFLSFPWGSEHRGSMEQGPGQAGWSLSVCCPLSRGQPTPHVPQCAHS